METEDFNKLKDNPQNPRRMSNQAADALAKSMSEFGDLSSIVFNTTTGQLVGGHQRKNVLSRFGSAKRLQITQRFNPAADDGTTALGYIIYDKKPFPYREVTWPLERELAANIAANKISGEFDNDLLAEITYQLQEESPDLLALTGLDQNEIDKLLKQSGAVDDEQEETDEKEPKLVFKITAEQKKFIEDVIRQVKVETQIVSGDEEEMNGKALLTMATLYRQDNPAFNDVFTPPEIPQE